MMNTPILSIILPVYNVERYLDRCLVSIEGQSFKDYELIFVDDHGQDGSIKKLLEYAEQSEKIKLVHNPRNLGTFHARKKGVESAKGQYIVFLDPDDELAHGFLGSLAAHLEENQSDLIYYGIEYVPHKKFYQSTPPVLPFQYSERVLDAIQKNKGKKIVWAGTPGKVYKRSFLEKVYGKLDVSQDYRYVYTEDKLLYYTALLENPSYSVLKINGYIYHNNDSSITNQRGLVDPSFLIDQLSYTTQKLKELVKKSDAKLLDSERAFFNFFLNESVNNQINLMRRYEDNGRNYLKYVWEAFKQIPDIKQLVRIFLYIISFKRIKL